MRRGPLSLLALAILLVTAACLPPNPGPSGLYLGIQDDITPAVTPRSQPVTWGAAPVIDESYGGTIYAGTPIEAQDPRPAALPGDLQPLRVWAAVPDNDLTGRPALLWFHGGGFALGVDVGATYGLANGVGKEYAQRGYVSFSVEYRIDTTLKGDIVPALGRPPSLCQWVQDNIQVGNQEWEDAKDQCARNIIAAQRDALAAVRWVRAHAAEYGVDPNKIAVGGFSAGAAIANLVAYQSEDVGDVSYFPGDVPSQAASRIQAGFGASGGLPTEDFQAPTTIDPGDAPVATIASEFDPAAPYERIKQTAQAARAEGLVHELASYCGENGHAMALYLEHKAVSDRQVTEFLARELKIYSGMRPPSAAPFCP